MQKARARDEESPPSNATNWTFQANPRFLALVTQAVKDSPRKCNGHPHEAAEQLKMKVGIDAELASRRQCLVCFASEGRPTSRLFDWSSGSALFSTHILLLACNVEGSRLSNECCRSIYVELATYTQLFPLSLSEPCLRWLPPFQNQATVADHLTADNASIPLDSFHLIGH